MWKAYKVGRHIKYKKDMVLAFKELTILREDRHINNYPWHKADLSKYYTGI